MIKQTKVFMALVVLAVFNATAPAATQTSHHQTQAHGNQQTKKMPCVKGFFERHKEAIKAMVISATVATSVIILSFFIARGPHHIMEDRKWRKEMREREKLEKMPKPLPPLWAPKPELGSYTYFKEDPNSTLFYENHDLTLELFGCNTRHRRGRMISEPCITLKYPNLEFKKFAESDTCKCKEADFIFMVKDSEKCHLLQLHNGYRSASNSQLWPIANNAHHNIVTHFFPKAEHCYPAWLGLVDNASAKAIDDELFRVSKTTDKVIVQGMSFHFDPTTKEARIGLEEKIYEVAKIIPEDLANKIAQAEKSWDNASALSKELFAKVFPQEQVETVR